MNRIDQAPFIEQHLFHEFRSFLRALEVRKKLKSSDGGFYVNVANDSIYLHARNLPFPLL